MNKVSLPDVTLLSVSSVELDDTQLALQISSRNVDFGAIKLFCSGLPSRKAANIEYVEIPPIDLMGYNRFVLGELHKHVDTPYCMLVQADGFLLNADLWNPEFLDYDYIGAPWPERVPVQPGNRFLALDKNRVGNGGFSLRSRKLLEATAGIDYDVLDFPVMSEDIVVCHYLYDAMRAQGIRFAPVELAASFSVETLHKRGTYSALGFHGKGLRDMLFQEAGLRQPIIARDLPELRHLGKIGRNEPCPCGSRRKYKHCHGKPR